MKTLTLLLAATLIPLAAAIPDAEAGSRGRGLATAASRASCEEVQSTKRKRPNRFTIARFTNYEPSRGGINGRCGTSAIGLNACNYYMEDHVAGRRPAAMVAVSQRGGSSGMFGGVYRLDPITKKGVKGKNGCTLGMAGDRYGKGSNGKAKMDVVTRGHSRLRNQINSARGQVVLVGAVDGLRNGNHENGGRKIRRN